MSCITVPPDYDWGWKELQKQLREIDKEYEMTVRLAETGEITLYYVSTTPSFYRYEGHTKHGRRVVQYFEKHRLVGIKPRPEIRTIITIEEVKEELREIPNYAEQSRRAEKFARHASAYGANLDLFRIETNKVAAYQSQKMILDTLTEIRDLLKPVKKVRKEKTK